MNSSNRDSRFDLWSTREAANVSFPYLLFVFALVSAGLLAVIRLADWWFRTEHVADTGFFVLLSLAFWYGIGRILVGWFNYLGIRKPQKRDAPPGVRVAIFTTSSPGEPLAMFEKTLAACRKIRYPHTTYLLDDTKDPRFREVAERHGAVWLELVGIPGAKAGKINKALSMTTEDFILVLDPDHIPFPDFLDHVLGHFADERTGFVQVCQAYYNQSRSFVACGAAEQTYGFYGPILMGMFGHHSSLAIGANCTFRRTALESIGGHGIGLAEDMVTAIRLHAAGWHSVYIPIVVSRGLVPEDLGSFFKQQLKWSRGVYEILFSELPVVWRSLRWRQRLSYFLLGTYYLCGVTTFIYLLIPYCYLWFGFQPASMPFAQFLTMVGPVGLTGIILYLAVQRSLCHPELERGLHWRSLMLKIGCWPIYFLGTILSITRTNIPYIPTSKEAKRGEFFRLAWPHLAVCLTYCITVGKVAYERIFIVPEEILVLSTEVVWGMVAFATMTIVFSLGILYAAWKARDLPQGSAWDAVPDSLVGP
ncbi:MAG: glycosyltransferase [Ignavibacteriales bacterium]|nr:glycosyltransferase [Ignavibacteriales bacterium]